MPSGGTRFAVARGLGSAAAALSRLTGSGGGTTIGGRVMLAVDPFALRRAAAGRRLILVSGTNGKSTTRTLLTAALRTRGAVVSNEGGANMPAGLTAALAADPNAGVGVLEVDEPYLPAVITATRPAAVVLLNISRDQLDRYAEVRRLAGGWREALGRPSAPHVIANADDPLIAWAAGTARSVTWVSVGLRWRADATVCPACGGLIHFGLADWRCDCGWRRPLCAAPVCRATRPAPAGEEPGRMAGGADHGRTAAGRAGGRGQRPRGRRCRPGLALGRAVRAAARTAGHRHRRALHGRRGAAALRRRGSSSGPRLARRAAGVPHRPSGRGDGNLHRLSSPPQGARPGVTPRQDRRDRIRRGLCTV